MQSICTPYGPKGLSVVYCLRNNLFFSVYCTVMEFDADPLWGILPIPQMFTILARRADTHESAMPWHCLAPVTMQMVWSRDKADAGITSLALASHPPPCTPSPPPPSVPWDVRMCDIILRQNGLRRQPKFNNSIVIFAGLHLHFYGLPPSSS